MTDITMLEGYQPYEASFEFPHDRICLKVDDKLVRLIKDNNKIIGLDWEHKRIEFKPTDFSEITAILNVLDGTNTLTDVMDKANLPASTVKPILQTLYEIGALALNQPESMPSLAFYRHTVARMRAKRRQILIANPILSPDLNRDQLLGFLIDSYHFAASASSHISLAIAQAPNKRVEHVMSSYLKEEYWHGELLAKGIVKAGISQGVLEQSWPSFPVLGIINFIRHYARTDLQAYGLCTAITESDTSSITLKEDKGDSWQEIKALKLLPDEVFEAFQKHEQLDYDAQHADIPEVLFSANEMLSFARQQELVRIVECYIAMVGDAYRYLKAYYADLSLPLWFKAAA